MMLCLCCMAFVSCGDDDEEAVDQFKSCVFKAEPAFSEDILNLYDITMTYTAMDGTVKQLTPDKGGAFPVLDECTKLPATMKIELKAVKKPTFDEYLNSKDDFEILFASPMVQASYVTVGGKSKVLWEDGHKYFYVNVSRESALMYLKNHDDLMNFTIVGTFSKSGNGCTFVKK